MSGHHWDYDGPIYISDIDETLRDNTKNQQIPGALEILQMVSRKKVPIVYLTAGNTGYRETNTRFLSKFPHGVLVDRHQTFLNVDIEKMSDTNNQDSGHFFANKNVLCTYPVEWEV